MNKLAPAPDEYPDRNGNGVPDAFENRAPISELLFQEQNQLDQYQAQANSNDTIILEVEIKTRPALKGELYFIGNPYTDLERRRFDGPSGIDLTIVRRVIACPYPLPPCLQEPETKTSPAPTPPAPSYFPPPKISHGRCPVKETAGQQRQCTLARGHSGPHELSKLDLDSQPY